MNTKYKILALDIDGTLTTSNKDITPETVRAIKNLQEKGIHVLIASGRSEYGVRHIAKELDFEKYGSYIMAFNGGRLINCATGGIVYDTPLALSYLDEIYGTACAYGLGIIGYEDDCLVSGNGVDEYQEYDAAACRMKLIEVDDFPRYFKKPFNKCLLSGEPDRVKKVFPAIKRKLEGRLNVCTSEQFFIEVLPHGVHKAAALDNLARKLGCSAADVVCCGDGMNDLTMIEYAGLGVAMGNACDAVQEKADYITSSNDDNGVLKVIQKFFGIAGS
ncbi:MAG: HAD family phosphatase [Lachnospiraceae bacterium]|nr:HAD family phosphatase [Lachnospiraceae bacterium]